MTGNGRNGNGKFNPLDPLGIFERAREYDSAAEEMQADVVTNLTEIGVGYRTYADRQFRNEFRWLDAWLHNAYQQAGSRAEAQYYQDLGIIVDGLRQEMESVASRISDTIQQVRSKPLPPPSQ